MGAIGSAAGLLLGMVLGRGLVVLVTQTINDLYFTVSVRGIVYHRRNAGQGAAAWPWRDAGRRGGSGARSELHATAHRAATLVGRRADPARAAAPLPAWASRCLRLGGGILLAADALAVV